MKRLILAAVLGMVLPTFASAQEASQPKQMTRDGERCSCCEEMKQRMQQMQGTEGMQMRGIEGMQRMPQGQASTTEGRRQ